MPPTRGVVALPLTVWWPSATFDMHAVSWSKPQMAILTNHGDPWSLGVYFQTLLEILFAANSRMSKVQFFKPSLTFFVDHRKLSCEMSCLARHRCRQVAGWNQFSPFHARTSETWSLGSVDICMGDLPSANFSGGKNEVWKPRDLGTSFLEKPRFLHRKSWTSWQKQCAYNRI